MEGRGSAGRTGGSADARSAVARARTMSTPTSPTPPITYFPTQPLVSTATTPTPPPLRARHIAHGHGKSCPFSSSCGAVGPTGATFQLELVGVPGGSRVRVCQGALVQDAILGQCWVCSTFAPPLNPMASMAAAQGRPAQPRAMVVRDGAVEVTDADDVVAKSTSRAPNLTPSSPCHAYMRTQHGGTMGSL